MITALAGIFILTLQADAAHGAERPAVQTSSKQMSVVVTPSAHKTIPRTYRVALYCDTRELRTMGLQGFRRLEQDEAALFAFPKPEAVTFWMGSVSFPIDIVFIAAEGRVARVYQGIRPGSLNLYPSGEPVKWVIETAAGSGIREGDVVRIFKY